MQTSYHINLNVASSNPPTAGSPVLAKFTFVKMKCILISIIKGAKMIRDKANDRNEDLITVNLRANFPDLYSNCLACYYFCYYY